MTYHRTAVKRPTRLAVARSLRDLKALFGKRPPKHGNALRKQGADAADKAKLKSEGASR